MDKRGLLRLIANFTIVQKKSARYRFPKIKTKGIISHPAPSGATWHLAYQEGQMKAKPSKGLPWRARDSFTAYHIHIMSQIGIS